MEMKCYTKHTAFLLYIERTPVFVYNRLDILYSISMERMAGV